MNASLTHFHVGQKVRKAIEELRGTMPEELPQMGILFCQKPNIARNLLVCYIYSAKVTI